jgi:hypothetical protein
MEHVIRGNAIAHSPTMEKTVPKCKTSNVPTIAVDMALVVQADVPVPLDTQERIAVRSLPLQQRENSMQPMLSFPSCLFLLEWQLEALSTILERSDKDCPSSINSIYWNKTTAMLL